MRNLKKVLALVIAFSMMLSVVAFAGYADVEADADYAGAVELLSALDIFQGDENGNFNPDNTITRAEMAAIIIRAKGLESAAQASKGATMFPDVAADHWASGYVNLANQNGIITGTDAGLFEPDATLTYEAAVAMIVRALGFEPIAQKKGGWTAGYVVVANSYKVTEGAAANATRANLAVLMANALETPMMDQTSYGSDEKYEVLDGKNGRDYRTLLTDMDIYVATGVVGDKDVDEIGFTIAEDSDDGEFTTKKATQTFVIGESDIAAYTYQQVDAYVAKDGRDYVVKAVVPSTIGETFELLSDDVDAVLNEKVEDKKIVAEVEYFVDAANSNKTKTIDVALKGIEYNKQAYEGKLADLVKADDIELVFIENTGDNTYDMLVATNYKSFRVDYVDADRDRLALKNDKTVNFDFEDEEATIILADMNGNALTLADFAKDDVVAIVADGARPSAYEKYIEVIKLSDAAVTGTVDETYTSNDVYYVVINGEEYATALTELEAGDEGTFYIGLTGKVIDFDGSLAGENYAYILEGAIADGAFSGDQWQIKLLTEADGVVIYDIKKEYHDTVAKYITDNFKDFNKDNTAFLWEDATDKGAKYRLVTYKVNSNGEIKELLAAETKDTKVTTFDKANDEFDAGKQDINGASLEDDVVIFNVSGKYAKDAYATDVSYLVDEAKYTGFALEDADGEYSVMVIADLESAFDATAGLAIATKVSTGKDAEGEEVTKISYVQGEEEGVLTFNDDAEAKGKDTAIAVGTAFVFTADADGVVGEYLVVASVDEKTGKFALASDGVTELEKALTKGNDVADIKLGYIMNENMETRPKGELIDLGGGVEVVIPSSANMYTYNTIGRNKGIVVSDFMYDGDYAANDDKENPDDLYACPVLVFEFDNDVIDVYSTNARIKIVLQ